jgi:hypothetical protein
MASYSCWISIDRSISPSEIPLPSSPPKASKKSGSSKHALKFKGDDSKKKTKKAKTDVAESDETGGAGGSGGGGKDSLSVDETNKLRASLGMCGDLMVLGVPHNFSVPVRLFAMFVRAAAGCITNAAISYLQA